MNKVLFIISLYLPMVCSGQTPSPQFNHCFLVLDSSDYSAMVNSEFIQNEFCGFFTSKASTGSISWSGAYMFGDVNYVELFAPSTSVHQTGSSGLALSTDKIGDLTQFQKILEKEYRAKIELKERKLSDTLIPWFKALYINDSSLSSKSDIGFWIMEYERAYFAFNRLKTDGDSVTREHYLQQHKSKREGKSLQRFTGVVLRADEREIDYLSTLLMRFSFVKSGINTFVSSEGFTISFEAKDTHSKYSIATLRFDTNTSIEQQISISNDIQIVIHGNQGQIEFK